MAVVLVVALIACCAICGHRRSEDALERREIPEEVLARQMPGEYPGYKSLFESQARARLNLPLMR